MAQLFVGQLPFNKFYPTDLLDLFEPYGKVIAQEIHLRKGHGFVTYELTTEADAAILALHGKYVAPGRHEPLQVIYSKGTKMISEFGRSHRKERLAARREGEGSHRGSHSKGAVSQTPLSAAGLPASAVDGMGVVTAYPYPFMVSPPLTPPVAAATPLTGPFSTGSNLVSPLVSPPHGAMPPAMYSSVSTLNASQPAMMFVVLAPPQGGVHNASLLSGSFGSASMSNISVPPPLNLPISVSNPTTQTPSDAAQYMYYPLGFLPPQ